LAARNALPVAGPPVFSPFAFRQNSETDIEAGSETPSWLPAIDRMAKHD